MTCDHVGKLLLPQVMMLQIIGRLAFPIFAYMIAEGCYYTRSRAKYLRNIAAVALLCQIVYFVAMGSLYQCIMVTFSLSVLLIFGWSSLLDSSRTPARTAAVILLTVAVLGFFAKTDGKKFFIASAVAGVVLFLVFGSLMGVCASAEMRCNVTALWGRIVAGVVVAGSLVGLLAGKDGQVPN